MFSSTVLFFRGAENMGLLVYISLSSMLLIAAFGKESVLVSKFLRRPSFILQFDQGVGVRKAQDQFSVCEYEMITCKDPRKNSGQADGSCI
jgi:hypothetical protein